MADQTCPDCDEPLFYTFTTTAGLGAWKRGDGSNTTPDTDHYVCFPCHKTWQQRLDGPLTPDVVGDIVFFSCRENDCGAQMFVTRESDIATEIELTCANGHVFRIEANEDGGLVVGPRLT